VILQHDFQYLPGSSPVQSALIAEMIEATKRDGVWPLMISAVHTFSWVTFVSFLNELMLGAFEASSNITVKRLELVLMS
jgi:hypothetical protein